ncbi:MAG: uroporphyrinogen decarboxylase family protein [Myxococcota bacterium]|nr:uroporphyrinogen decarboxylase family protein [Myxococcota bacterium]
MESYCQRLLREVGGDGGFILGTGCSVPPNAKPENFRAMIETGKQ